MDALSYLLPTMNINDLVGTAVKWADDLVWQLEQFNERNPTPKLSIEDSERVLKEFGDETPRPTPKDCLEPFRAVFCRYLASRYIIVP